MTWVIRKTARSFLYQARIRLQHDRLWSQPCSAQLVAVLELLTSPAVVPLFHICV